MPRRFPVRSALLGLAISSLLPGFTRGATPGEATDLEVTAYDPASGALMITWTPACSATDHHIEFGPLADVSVLGWSGQVCGIGSSGSYTGFDPGPGSWFFVVVGDDGVGVEGSYGVGRIDGVPVERPEDTLDPVCPRVQDLSLRCDGPFSPTMDMTLYRPMTGSSGASGAPFQRWAVPASEEESPGAGIRVNGDDDDADGIPDRNDTAVSGENDLVEVLLSVDPPMPPPGYEYVLLTMGGGTPAANLVGVWNESDKTTPVTNPISFSTGTRTVWIEKPNAGETDLYFAAVETAGQSMVASDRVHLRPFTSTVIALGGEGQVPADPPLEPANHGTFQLAITLYRMGYDVHMYDEDVVISSGAGAAYDEVVSAIQRRGVSHVAIYGYSHGGGSTQDLALRLDGNRASIGAFTIDFTAYVDGIRNNSDIDLATETELPPSTAYHANYYETRTCSSFPPLCGGPISGASLNVNVTATPWGSALTHYTIDDAPDVLNGILDLLVTHVPF